MLLAVYNRFYCYAKNFRSDMICLTLEMVLQWLMVLHKEISQGVLLELGLGLTLLLDKQFNRTWVSSGLQWPNPKNHGRSNNDDEDFQR